MQSPCLLFALALKVSSTGVHVHHLCVWDSVDLIAVAKPTAVFYQDSNNAGGTRTTGKPQTPQALSTGVSSTRTWAWAEPKPSTRGSVPV